MNVHSSEVEVVSKVMSLAAAMHDHVRPGDHVHLAYSEARPNGAVLALAKRFKGTAPGLTISSGGLVSSQSCLVSEGLVTRLIASFVGDNYPNGAPNPLFQRAINSGSVVLEEATLWTLVARLAAGALGVPFLPVNSLRGSDLAKQEWVRETPDPATGLPTTVVSALNPDVTIVHGVAADRHGNVILSPPYGEAAWGSLATKRGVIAVVESIVDDEVIARNQALVGVPAHLVTAVCEAPFGAHPYGLYSTIPEVSSYVEDEEFILAQRKASRTDVTQQAWIDEWLHGLPDHDAYLEHVGYHRLQRLSGAAAAGAWKVGLARDDNNATPASAEEIMVLEAAHLIGAKVTAGGFDVLMTGIGFANLATWVAHRNLASTAQQIPLMAEIGAYGYEPRPGDPFIFAHRNLPTCTWMTGVTEILGGILASGRGGTLAVLGAGTVDARGNTNSSRAADGSFLVGSGGANDIASGAQEVVLVIKHGRARLVAEVPFVTCPGDRVSTVVTSQCVLERDSDGELVMTRVLNSGGDLEVAVKDALAGLGWDCRVATQVTPFSPVLPADLDLLRSFDPRHAFLPDPTAVR
jgi:acyl CoA:acetate/3-ketoacid CoA transferase alpha subunit/acyl CoA:acetate/3-ketoacid CoA transferase beta subunit